MPCALYFSSSLFSLLKHIQALIESARNVAVWKEFAMEASHCRDYSDIGRLLLELQSVNPSLLDNSEIADYYLLTFLFFFTCQMLNFECSSFHLKLDI